MPAAARRRLEESSKFKKSLRSLAKKKDRDLPKRVHQELASRLKQGPSDNDKRIKRVQDLPVYKMRVGAQRGGTRGGARVVYYCDQERLLALNIYLKSDMDSADYSDIKRALQSSDLWPNE